MVTSVWFRNRRIPDLQKRMADVVERVDAAARFAMREQAIPVTLSEPLLRFHDEAFLKRLIGTYQTIPEEPISFLLSGRKEWAFIELHEPLLFFDCYLLI